MKASDESIDSLLKDLVEIIDESPQTCTTSPVDATAASSHLYLDWPTGNDIMAPPSADWPTTTLRQTAAEVATWSGTTGCDVTVALRDYTGGFSEVAAANSPATWAAVFEAAAEPPAVPLKSVCLLPPERFDVSRPIPTPGFVSLPLVGRHGDDVAMTTPKATQGILLHNADTCDKLGDSLGDLDLDIDLDAERSLDVRRSVATASAILTLDPSGVWLITPSSPALPLNALPLRGLSSEMDSSLEDVGGSGKSRLCSRCLSDSEVQLTCQASPLSISQGSKRQRKGTMATRTPGVRGRSTSEAGPSRTSNTEDVDIDSFRLDRRREQNRRAARVCRERKRAMSTSMVKEYQDLLSSNTSLRFEIRQLQQEEQSLQVVLEKHLTTCTSMTSSLPTSSTLDSTLALTSDDPMNSGQCGHLQLSPMNSDDLL